MTPTEPALAGEGALRALCERAGVTLLVFARGADGQPQLVLRCGEAAAGDAAITSGVAALAGDADRATRHLGTGSWERLSVECSQGSLGMARAAGGGHLAVVSAPDGTPAALAERLATRAVSMMNRAAT
jgi:hypothetical protein